MARLRRIPARLFYWFALPCGQTAADLAAIHRRLLGVERGLMPFAALGATIVLLCWVPVRMLFLASYWCHWKLAAAEAAR